MKSKVFALFILIYAIISLNGHNLFAGGEGAESMPEKIHKSDKEWKNKLTPEQYHILREKGTERAFSGEYWNNHEKGKYVCAACGAELFDSRTKFDSGTGWPSFTRPVDKKMIKEEDDSSFGMRRTEVLCHVCGGHLGHVFPDGPKPEGLRYCINSAALKFKKSE